jgi:uncharacterized NAD-dependent epimerase/dehydratase family protein
MTEQTLERARRRYVILSEGVFGKVNSKTAMGVIRYGADAVVAVIDSTQPGKNVSDWMGAPFDIPVVASLDEALPYRPTALLLGTAPQGGKIPPAWRKTILAAIEHGLDVVSGLHEFITEDAEFTTAAGATGVELVDHRKPPERKEVSAGRRHAPGKHVILTVGTDCAIGKMSVSLELRKAAVNAGLPAVFVASGQTGIMIEGWGVAVDRVISDFVQGTVEWLVEQAEEKGDWIFVEGQGSLDHPAYSSVTLGLIHGATPDAMVLVHEPTRTEHHGWEGKNSPLHSIPEMIRIHEEVASLVSPSRVVGIALNTTALPESQARAEIARVAAQTGLPTDDPVRFGAERLMDGIRGQLETPAAH